MVDSVHQYYIGHYQVLSIVQTWDNRQMKYWLSQAINMGANNRI
jgi:hypothetical protein